MLKIKFLLVASVCITLLPFASTVWAQGDLKLTNLVDKVVDVRIKKNEQYSGYTVVEVTEGTEPGSIKTIRIKPADSKRAKSVSVTKIVEIFLDGQPLDVAFNKEDRALARSQEKRTERLEWERETNSSLRRSRSRLWAPLTQAEHDKFIASHNKFLEATRSALPTIDFRYVETDYFMFLTNLSSAEVDGLIVYLDDMYAELCTAFGIPPTQNIWCGKCVVVAFRAKEEFLAFERHVMKTEANGAQGLCHTFGDGRVIFSGYQGQSGFPSVLVHETSHGFMHRYLSSARIPSWLNEGMADWIADRIVKGNRNRIRQKQSALAIRKAGTLGSFFTTRRIQFQEYGVASSMVQLLLNEDKGDGKFKEFFDGIKTGKAPEQSLKESFSLTYQELTIMYAEAIGMNDLR